MPAGRPPDPIKLVTRKLNEALRVSRTEINFISVRCNVLGDGEAHGARIFFRPIPKQLEDGWAEATALDVYEEATSHAEALGRHSKFVVTIEGRDDDNRERNLTCIFRVSVENGEQTVSEQPTQGGLVSQAQRHADNSNKMMLGIVAKMGEVFDRMAQMTAASQEAALRAEERRAASFEKLAEALENNRTASLEETRLAFQADTKKQLLDMLGKALPRLLPGKAGTEIAKALDAPVALTDVNPPDWRDTLTRAQFRQLQGMMPDTLFQTLQAERMDYSAFVPWIMGMDEETQKRLKAVFTDAQYTALEAAASDALKG